MPFPPAIWKAPKRREACANAACRIRVRTISPETIAQGMRDLISLTRSTVDTALKRPH